MTSFPYPTIRSFYFVNLLNRKYTLTKKNAENRKKQTKENEVNLYGWVDDKQNTFVDMDGKEYFIKEYPKVKIKPRDAVAAILNSDQTVDIYWGI